jgi:hypothetical protein
MDIVQNCDSYINIPGGNSVGIVRLWTKATE